MATWSLRFTGVSYVGPLTMAVGLLAVFALLKWRGQAVSEIGLVPIDGPGPVFREALRLLALTGDTKSGRILAAILQAAWFGSLHPSQGGSGMVITSAIGLAFAWFYLSRPRRNLWPLILVHATVDTIVLSMSWLGRRVSRRRGRDSLFPGTGAWPDRPDWITVENRISFYRDG